jgi:autotransporter passenger strand-loop-strand repeat protein
MTTTSVTSGQTVSGLTLNNGDLEYVLSGGTSSATTINSSGTEYVSSGGSDLGALISGGTQFDYGLASGATVFAGSQVVESGGTASATTTSASGGLLVESGGLALATNVDSRTGSFNGGMSVYSGGTASGSIINSGGAEFVYSGGTESGAIINNGGFLQLGTGISGSTLGAGTGVNITVSSGGSFVVLSGGLADPTTIYAGGSETVRAGGTDLGALISGGTQFDYGLASGATVFAGSQVVESGGSASSTVISGGTEDVLSGGVTSNTTISGGTLELAIGGSAAGAITFAGPSGLLKIDGTMMPTNAISGYAPGDTLDLAGVTYSSAGTVTLKAGNLLQIVERGVTYNLQLDPSQNYSEDSFALSSDVSGGTKVTTTVPSGAETTEAPLLTVSNSLSVHPGTPIPMGITATPVDSDDTVSITIKGVPSYEKITAGPGETVTTTKGPGNTTTYTITSTTPGASITDLTLTSTYKGKGSPVSPFTVTASNTTSGETATSASKTVTVTDPPILTANATNGASPPSLDHVVALFNQYLAGGSSNEQGAPITNALSQTVTNQEQFLAQPHHG